MNKLLKIATASAVAVVAAPAMAALPAEATAVFTGLTDNYTAVSALMWPLFGLVTGGFILLKIVKRGANKAT